MTAFALIIIIVLLTLGKEQMAYMVVFLLLIWILLRMLSSKHRADVWVERQFKEK